MIGSLRKYTHNTRMIYIENDGKLPRALAMEGILTNCLFNLDHYIEQHNLGVTLIGY